MEPGPDESVADPFHWPATLTPLDGGGDAAVGEEDPPPPPQAAVHASAASPSAYARRARRIMGLEKDTSGAGCGPGSIPDGEAVLPYVGAAHQHSGFRIEADAWIAPETAGGFGDRMTARNEGAAHGGGNRALDAHPVLAMRDAGRFAGFLHVHPEIDQIHEHLCLALRLVIAAHDAERETRRAVLHHEGGNQGVQRPFVRSDHVR